MNYHDPIQPSKRELELLNKKYYLDEFGALKRNGSFEKIGSGDKYLRVAMWTDGKRRSYSVHHVVWFIYYGVWPKVELDHKDRNTLNNLVCNLEETNRSKNCTNKYKRFSHLPRGVTRRNGKYCVQLRINGRGNKIYMGMFDKLNDAVAAISAYENRV